MRTCLLVCVFVAVGCDSGPDCEFEGTYELTAKPTSGDCGYTESLALSFRVYKQGNTLLVDDLDSTPATTRGKFGPSGAECRADIEINTQGLIVDDQGTEADIDTHTVLTVEAGKATGSMTVDVVFYDGSGPVRCNHGFQLSGIIK